MPVNSSKQIVLSVSRRTDIPAFYMPWFMDRIQKGVFEVENPYNGRITRIPATPEAVHTIVFWSKDFGPFLRNRYGDRLEDRGYRLFFNFTINSSCPELEPRVPPLEDRLDQLERLSARFSPRSILWRFDPVCFYDAADGVRDNLTDFNRIADKAACLGIERCVTSFLDLYAKIRRRAETQTEITFRSPPLEKQKEIILEMKSYLEPLGISLFTCCEKELSQSLPPEAGVHPSACIPGSLITELYGGGISLRKDPGQRTAAGCGCVVSSDIGSYKNHPCFHNCLFCYANPAAYRKSESRRQRSYESTRP